MTNSEVFSPKTNRDMKTVKTGAELLTVSANETGVYHKAINPNNIVEYLFNKLSHQFIHKLIYFLNNRDLRLPTAIKLRLKFDFLN